MVSTVQFVLKPFFGLSVFLFFAFGQSTHLAAQGFEEVDKCDEYAAHPNDPNRWATGVADEDIIPGPAVKYCREAVAKHPDTPRFAFQLGRALWAANKIDEGTEVFLKLEKDFEYGPVYAYLGDAYMYGLGGVEKDEDLAVSLYQIAADDGFAPAQDVLASLGNEDGGAGGDGEQVAVATPEAPNAPQTPPPAPETVMEQPQQAVAEPPFDPSQYTQPRLIGALYSGNFADMKDEDIGKTNYVGLSNAFLYVEAFHKHFSEQVNFIDQSCVNIYRPDVQRQLNSKIRTLMTGGQGGLENGLNFGAEQGFKAMADMFKDLNAGGMDRMMRTQQNLQALAESGGIDAAHLISTYGCQSETVKRIYTNIAAYAAGRPGNPVTR